MTPDVQESRQPTDADIDAMVVRIAGVRRMTDEQAAAVRGMLMNLSATLFNLRRPSTPELGQMLKAPDQPTAAQTRLQLMTDVLFGTQAGAAASHAAVASLVGVSRPSPQALDGIVQRVVSRSGDKVEEAAVRSTLSELLDGIFGPRYVPMAQLTPSSIGTGRSEIPSDCSNATVRECLGDNAHSMVMSLCEDILAPL